MNGDADYSSGYSDFAGNSAISMLQHQHHHGATPSPPPAQSPLPPDSMYNPQTTQAMYAQFPMMSQAPHFAPFAAPAGIMQPTLRTVYLGNLTRNTTVEDILNHVRQGAIESCKILEDKNCAFVTFMDPHSAQMFHQDATVRHLTVHGNELKVGWGKPTSPPSPQLLAAIQAGATRVVFIGNTDPSFNAQVLRDEFSRFGTVDTVRIIPDKKLAFIHMASVGNAVRAVSALQSDDAWASRRVNFGKDRCQPGTFKQPSYMMPPMGMMGVPGMNMPMGMMNQGYGVGMQLGYGPGQGAMYGAAQNGSVQPNGQPNRTVYLGGIHAETTTKELCDHIRGGILQNIKYLSDKGIAFVTFVTPEGASAFFARATQDGLMIHGKRIKIGWGKTQPMPPYVVQAINNGATRNVYMGNVDLAQFSEGDIKAEFEQYGEIEMINVIPEKSIAFVNFSDITSAIGAVETKRNDPTWSQFRINYGKDRCGNPPKPGPGSGPAIGRTIVPGGKGPGAAVNGASQPPAASEGSGNSSTARKSPADLNGTRSPPPTGPRPVTLSAFLAPPAPRPNYQQHHRSQSHQIRASNSLAYSADREFGAVGSGRPSSAQAMADGLVGEVDGLRIPFKPKHRSRKSEASASSVPGVVSSVPEE